MALRSVNDTTICEKFYCNRESAPHSETHEPNLFHSAIWKNYIVLQKRYIQLWKVICAVFLSEFGKHFEKCAVLLFSIQSLVSICFQESPFATNYELK